jgi:transcriptional regulator with PAS, ATPase and Fis domain
MNDLDALRPSASQLYAQRNLTLDDLEGYSASMRATLERARTAAPYDIEILLSGETGTGKNLLALAIHNAGPRRKGPFVAINVAAIPEHLVESELFGHQKGSFTGAVEDRTGFLELAQGGTLFLDEISDMPPSLQAKLLTAIEYCRFYRVGGSSEVAVDVRLISATKSDVRGDVRRGALREDLYYRLARVVIPVPSLRDRRDDILPLARLFVAEDNLRFTRSVSGFTPECEARLVAYSWPGNVRELRGAISNAVCMSGARILDTKDVFSDSSPWIGDRGCDPGGSLSPAGREGDGETPWPSLEEVERRHIERTLRAQAGNIKRAAEALKISRQTLYAKMKQFGIAPREGEAAG